MKENSQEKGGIPLLVQTKHSNIFHGTSSNHNPSSLPSFPLLLLPVPRVLIIRPIAIVLLPALLMLLLLLLLGVRRLIILRIRCRIPLTLLLLLLLLVRGIATAMVRQQVKIEAVFRSEHAEVELA